jgi:hypothetical protein
MSDGARPIQQLWGELRDLEARYELAKEAFSAEDAFVLWSALWRFSEKVIVDHRRLKVAERKQRRTR